MRSPILNPIRFYKSGNLPDYITRFPNIDNVTQRQEWTLGVHPGQYYKEWIAGQTMYLQFERESGETTNIAIYKYNETTLIYDLITTESLVDISPVGWIGNHIYQYEYTPTVGTYYFQLPDYGVISDKFIVISDLNLSKQLVKIKYSHSINDFGCIFNDGTNYYYFNQYITGQLIYGDPQNAVSGFSSDRGELTKLQATPIRLASLVITNTHYTYGDHINMIASCDWIEVNGITYQNTEPPTKEDIADSDLKNFTLKLQQTGNDYYYH